MLVLPAVELCLSIRNALACDSGYGGGEDKAEERPASEKTERPVSDSVLLRNASSSLPGPPGTSRIGRLHKLFPASNALAEPER